MNFLLSLVALKFFGAVFLSVRLVFHIRTDATDGRTDQQLTLLEKKRFSSLIPRRAPKDRSQPKSLIFFLRDPNYAIFTLAFLIMVGTKTKSNMEIALLGDGRMLQALFSFFFMRKHRGEDRRKRKSGDFNSNSRTWLKKFHEHGESESTKCFWVV